MAADDTKQQTRQGWTQTFVIIGSVLVTGALAFAKLEALADKALETGIRAETKADAADFRLRDQMNELTRIRTVLEERLPKRSQLTKDE